MGKFFYISAMENETREIHINKYLQQNHAYRIAISILRKFKNCAQVLNVETKTKTTKCLFKKKWV